MLGHVFERIGKSVDRRPIMTIAIWLIVVALSGAFAIIGVNGESIFERLTTGEPAIPGSQSDRGMEILRENSSQGEAITLMVLGVGPDSQAMVEPMTDLTNKLAEVPGLESFHHPMLDFEGAQSEIGALFTAADGKGFLAIATLDHGLTESQASAAHQTVVAEMRTAGQSIVSADSNAKATIGSNQLVIDEITAQIKSDLITGELLALPLALIIMVLVFGGFLAAAMPLAGAGASIIAGLGVILGMSYLLTIDASIINVATILGLGLSIDYGLLIVSRFREEITKATSGDSNDRLAVRAALVKTLGTAGRTVAFSGLTVAISIAGLMLFTPDILRAIGAVGVVIVLLAVLTALFLVPALLRLTGTRLARPSMLDKIPGLRTVIRHTADVKSDEGVFSKLALQVQKHPVIVLVSCVLLLVFLALPAANLHMRNSGIELLPTSSSQRQFTATLGKEFPQTRGADIMVVTDASSAGSNSLAQQIGQVEGIDKVLSVAPVGDYHVIGATITDQDPAGPQAVSAVKEIRSLDTRHEVMVVGQAAGQIDFTEALMDRVWYVVGIIAAATFILLFLMTGSIVIPLKALLTNIISLGASMGILVWTFQEGHLTRLLNYTPTGGIETFVVALVLAFAFGLAMDYEVFLLSRIKELVDKGMDSEEAVRKGLQRSGRIITSAAAIIIVVFAGFVAGDLIIIKQVGFALAVAIFIDATIVRMLLVPATMTLLGKYNWWSPAPLAKVYNKFKIIH